MGGLYSYDSESTSFRPLLSNLQLSDIFQVLMVFRRRGSVDLKGESGKREVGDRGTKPLTQVKVGS